MNDSKLPLIGKNFFCDKAYYGGVTKLYGENFFYYDVNSLYSFAALNSMPGINYKFIKNIGNNIDLNSLFGFFYCIIEMDNNYLGLLPVHT